MFTRRFKTGVVLAVAAFRFPYVLAELTQRPLGLPEPIDYNVNFTELFSSQILSSEAWARESWNGMTTFAHSTPLRCFGTDSGIAYDVAVLGKCYDI